MGGFERTSDGGVRVSKHSTWVSLGLVIALLAGTGTLSFWAASTLGEVKAEVSGLKQALNYSVDRTARALTIVNDQEQEIQILKREVAVLQNRLDNLDRMRGRDYNGKAGLFTEWTEQ